MDDLQNPLFLPAVLNNPEVETKTALYIHYRNSLHGFLGDEFCLVENRTRIL